MNTFNHHQPPPKEKPLKDMCIMEILEEMEKLAEVFEPSDAPSSPDKESTCESYT